MLNLQLLAKLLFFFLRHPLFVRIVMSVLLLKEEEEVAPAGVVSRACVLCFTFSGPRVLGRHLVAIVLLL